MVDIKTGQIGIFCKFPERVLILTAICVQFGVYCFDERRSENGEILKKVCEDHGSGHMN